MAMSIIEVTDISSLTALNLLEGSSTGSSRMSPSSGAPSAICFIKVAIPLPTLFVAYLEKLEGLPPILLLRASPTASKANSTITTRIFIFIYAEFDPSY
jgi:hypothetical protein